MMMILAAAVAAVFLGLSALHVYWACGGATALGAAVPEVDGAPAFKPGRAATLAVAAALFAAAVLVAWVGGVLPAPLPRRILAWPAVVLALVFAARWIGDFRLVGVFKRPSPSRFARMDSLLYAPLCLALAVAVGALAADALLEAQAD